MFIVWSVSCLIKILLIEIELIRKKFSIYGFFNVLSLLGLFAIIILGGKYFLFRNADYFSLSLIISLFLLLLGLTNVSPSLAKYFIIVSNINAFFPSLGIDKIKKYFNYKKIIIAYIIIFYSLFPLDFDIISMKIFFSICLVLSIFMFINTISSKFSTGNISNLVYLIIRIFYSVFLALYSRALIPIDVEDIVQKSNVVVLGIMFSFFVLVNFLLLTNRKIKTYKKEVGYVR